MRHTLITLFCLTLAASLHGQFVQPTQTNQNVRADITTGELVSPTNFFTQADNTQSIVDGLAGQSAALDDLVNALEAAGNPSWQFSNYVVFQDQIRMYDNVSPDSTAFLSVDDTNGLTIYGATGGNPQLSVPGASYVDGDSVLNADALDTRFVRHVGETQLEWDGIDATEWIDTSSVASDHSFIVQNSETGGNAITGISQSGAAAIKAIQLDHADSAAITVYREHDVITDENDGAGIHVHQSGTAPILSSSGNYGNPDMEILSNSNDPLAINIDGIQMFKIFANGAIRDKDGASFMAIRVTSAPTPTSSGRLGEVHYDGTYLYVCVASSTWRRISLTTTW